MTLGLTGAPLATSEFNAISALVYRIAGINLQEGKEGLVKTRLARRVQALGLSFAQYVEHVQSESGRDELVSMIDALTTNKTSFFRESQHFDFLPRSVLPGLAAAGGPLRFWSAGCSSGEEPYTLAMVLHEFDPALARRDLRILATDISHRILERARSGVYEASQLTDLPRSFAGKYLQPTDRPGSVRVSDGLRQLVSFARLNLMDPWPMKGPFQVIFCRNVMIYFDAPTQERLVRRFHDMLVPGGHLFVGHSESLTSLSHPFRYVQPAVYVR
jgi:chemotaxis protein methyltransferase CheR